MTRTTKPLSNQPSRRQVLLGAGAAGATILAAPALVRAQGTQRYLKPLVAGLNAREGDPSYNSIARIPEILREKYDVEMDIQIHPSSTLGTDLSQLEAVQIGFIDITSNVTGQFAQFSDAFTFIDLPYAVADWDHASRVFDSDLWKAQSQKFADATPLVPLHPVGAGGFRILWNNSRPTPTPDSVNGLRYRTTSSPAEIALVRAWGGNPTPLAWTETYNGLRTGVIEGIHVQPIWTYGFNMFEVLKHGTDVGGVFAIQFQVLNKNTFNSFSDVIKERFLLAAADAAREASAQDRALEAEFRQKLIDQGMEIYTPSDAEYRQWRDAGEGLWGELAAGIDPAILEQVVAMR